jgi:hypothetical protein
MLSFINGNCAGLRVTRVILRVLDPYFGGNGQLWLPSTSSIVYTAFLSKLPSNVQLYVYPYLLEAPSRQNWIKYAGTASSLEAVYKYATAWNGVLAKASSALRFSGVVTDGEEKVGFIDELPSVPGWKAAYGMTFGLAIGYDMTGSFLLYDKYVDQYYMEMYDFYNPSNGATFDYASSSLLNNPTAFVSLLMNTILPSIILNKYNSKCVFMWSNQQNNPAGCLYNLGGLNCGVNNDFGIWSPSAVNQFLAQVKLAHPIFASQPHAFFQFSFTPPSWM